MTDTPNGQPPISFTYTNHRGETATRFAVPSRVFFGSTEWHTDEQWLMEAFDTEKSALRIFALSECSFPITGQSKLSDGEESVVCERLRQISHEGFGAHHDDKNDAGQLAGAGAAYALNAGCQLYPYMGDQIDNPEFSGWTFDMDMWKPTTPRRDLVKAAALIIAEIERIDRHEESR